MMMRTRFSVAAALCLLAPPLPAADFYDDFEGGDFSNWNREYMNHSHSGKVVNGPEHPIRAGRAAARFEVRREDTPIFNGHRSEVSNMYRYVREFGTEHWYGWSVFFPQDWKDDLEPEIVTQWHGRHDDGEISRSPPLSFWTDRDGNLKLRRLSDSREITPGNNVEKTTVFDLGRVPKGVWTDWVLQVKWSYKSDGFIKLWKNGSVILNERGANCFNDKRGPYMQVGIYKWRWNREGNRSTTRERVLYYDEVRSNGPGGSYDDVAPRGNRPVFKKGSGTAEKEPPEPSPAAPDPEPVPEPNPELAESGDREAAPSLPSSVPSAPSVPAAPSAPDNSVNAPRGLAVFPQSDPRSRIRASQEDGPNAARNVFDGSLETRWSAEGESQWIRYDLMEPRRLSSIEIAWFSGDERVATFDVQVSDDGTSWRTVLQRASSSGTSLALERHSFAGTTARYIRIVGYGNNENAWNSITELKVVPLK